MTALAFVARGNGYTGKPVCPRHSSKKASFQDELSSDAKLAKACSLSTDVSQDTFEDILMLSQAAETSSVKLIQAETPEAA